MLSRLLVLAFCAAGALGTYGSDYGSGSGDASAAGASDAGASDGGAGYGAGAAGAGAASAGGVDAGNAGAKGCQTAESATATAHAGMPDAGAGQAKAAGKTHEVTVGGAPPNTFLFTPNFVMAAAGDTINFTFKQKNHTATQSTFDKPCAKMEGGKDSGFQPNLDGNANPAPTFQYTVVDTKPTWWFCAAKGHCGMGMGFAINPTQEKSLDKFLAAAKAQGGAAAGMTMSTVAAGATGAATAAPTATAQPPAVQSSVVAMPAPSGVVAGTLDGKGACSCYCGMGAFPNAAQGVGGMGGYGGAVPMKGGM